MAKKNNIKIKNSNFEKFQYSLKYKFSSTKDIKLFISEGNFLLDYTIKAKTEVTKIVDSMLVYDALIKASIIHFIFYSKELNLEKLTIEFNSKEYVYPTESRVILHSLVKGTLIRKISENFQKDFFIKTFLNTSKSNYDSRFSALFSLIISKSKSYEIERLQNLWIAMNGTYGFYFGEIVKKIIRPENTQERTQLKFFCFFNDFDMNVIQRSKSDEIGKKITKILVNIPLVQTYTRDYFESDMCKDQREKIYKILQENDITLKPYEYLIIYYAYYLRCNFFHANKPIPIIYLDKKQEWRTIQFINDLLEEYLDKTLVLFFDDNFLLSQKNKLQQHFNPQN